MPAHSLAAARGVRTQISIENSRRHEHPRSMNDGKRGLDTVSMSNERTCREMLIQPRMGPAGSIKSDQETLQILEGERSLPQVRSTQQLYSFGGRRRAIGSDQSITLSARAITAAGILDPRAAAVLRQVRRRPVAQPKALLVWLPEISWLCIAPFVYP
jgi:hypothetical protein